MFQPLSPHSPTLEVHEQPRQALSLVSPDVRECFKACKAISRDSSKGSALSRFTKMFDE